MNTIENAEQDAAPTLSEEDPTSAAEALREALEKADPMGLLRQADETFPHGAALFLNLMTRDPIDLYAGMSREQVAEIEEHALRQRMAIQLDADPCFGMTPDEFAEFKALIGAPLPRSRV